MINFDHQVNGIAFNENKTIHNKNWPYIPDHRYRILIIGGSGSGKIIDIDKTLIKYIYT